LLDDTDNSPAKDPYGRSPDMFGDKKGINKDLEESYMDINSQNFKVSTYALTEK